MSCPAVQCCWLTYRPFRQGSDALAKLNSLQHHSRMKLFRGIKNVEEKKRITLVMFPATQNFEDRKGRVGVLS